SNCPSGEKAMQPAIECESRYRNYFRRKFVEVYLLAIGPRHELSVVARCKVTDGIAVLGKISAVAARIPAHCPQCGLRSISPPDSRYPAEALGFKKRRKPTNWSTHDETNSRVCVALRRCAASAGLGGGGSQGIEDGRQL